MSNTSTPTRACTKCERVLPITSEFFCRDRAFKSGFRAQCKDCHRAIRAASLMGTWKGMIARCYDLRSASYKYYGGKGIRVCDRWRNSYEAFVQDMGERPEGFTLDRKDYYGDYTPDNCRWVDQQTQSRNRRDVKVIERHGRVQPMAAWATEHGMTRGTLKSRLDSGWAIERALIAPVRKASFNHGRIINLEHNGKVQSVEDWARELEVCAGTLRWRVRQGWSTERVLLTPIKARRKKA